MVDINDISPEQQKREEIIYAAFKKIILKQALGEHAFPGEPGVVVSFVILALCDFARDNNIAPATFRAIVDRTINLSTEDEQADYITDQDEY